MSITVVFKLWYAYRLWYGSRHYLYKLFLALKLVKNIFKKTLIELARDGGCQVEFSELKLDEFSLKVKKEYPSLSRKALLFLIPFTITYMYETEFSAMVTVKNKFRNKLNLDS